MRLILSLSLLVLFICCAAIMSRSVGITLFSTTAGDRLGALDTDPPGITYRPGGGVQARQWLRSD
jgi:hypothetical protein